MVGQKFITAEPDVTVSVLLFAGFFLWWKGVSGGGVSLSRWLSIGLVLTAAGLTKGPQPLAYFTLGVGAYVVMRRRWNDLPGFILANAIAALVVASWYWAVMIPGDVEGWMRHSRLSDGMTMTQWLRDHLDFVVSIFAAEWLPGSLLLFPAIAAIARNTNGRDNDLMLAAVLYAGLASLVLLVWPGGVATRYAMPANLALAVLGGLLFERWWFSQPWLIAASSIVVAGVSSYLILLGWIAMPLAPDLFRQSRISAQTIEAVRGVVPGPLYVSRSAADDNVLAYVAAPIREVATEVIGNLKPPALAILTDSELQELMAQNPGFRAIAHAVVNKREHIWIFGVQSN
jgi:4-amino-4-deoxy-L-arabinose transferase-like glycosyltransferase